MLIRCPALSETRRSGIWGNMDRWGIWTTLIIIENIFYKCHVIKKNNGI